MGRACACSGTGTFVSLQACRIAIIRGIVDEQKDRVIAAQLGISTHTFRSHLERMFRKLGVYTRVGVVVAVFSEALKVVVAKQEQSAEDAGDAPSH